MQSAKQIYLRILKEHHISNTRPRKLVFETLYFKNHVPIEIASLIKATSHSIDRSSVYRSVAVLEEIGVIRRIQKGWKYALELSEEFHGHHHHISCSRCGRITPITKNVELEIQIAELASKADYNIQDHYIEMVGVCKACQKHGTPDTSEVLGKPHTS